MDFLRHVLLTFLFMPCIANGQDTVTLTVHANSNPKLEVTGYRINLTIDEMKTVCDPIQGILHQLTRLEFSQIHYATMELIFQNLSMRAMD